MLIGRYFAGWTIREAFKRTVDSQAVVGWLKAEQALIRCGHPGRGIVFAGPFAHLETSPAAARYRERRRNYRNLLAERDAACVSARSPLMRHLQTAKLVATARRGGPTAEERFIPPAAWKELRIVQLKRCTIEERTEQKLRLHGVRIFPLLASSNALEHLIGKTLVEVCREFVFGDPQVMKLRKLAIEAGGQPAPMGFAWQGLASAWPLDLGASAPLAPPVGQPKAAALAQFADHVMASRFGCLIEQLAGDDVTVGIPPTGGSAARILRSLWQRPGMYLDLEKGDLYDSKPRERSFWERNAEQSSEGTIASYQRRSELHIRSPEPLLKSILIAPPLRSDVGLHVKPQVPDPVPSTTVQAGAGRQKAETRVITTVAAKSACRRWLVEEMKKSPAIRVRRKDDWWNDAKAKWPKLLARSAFDGCWAEAVQETKAWAWSWAGAPKKSK
jgi:hypothetical protein